MSQTKQELRQLVEEIIEEIAGRENPGLVTMPLCNERSGTIKRMLWWVLGIISVLFVALILAVLVK